MTWIDIILWIVVGIIALKVILYGALAILFWIGRDRKGE